MGDYVRWNVHLKHKLKKPKKPEACLSSHQPDCEAVCYKCTVTAAFAHIDKYAPWGLVVDSTAEGIRCRIRRQTHTHSVYSRTEAWGLWSKTEIYFRMTVSPAPLCYSDMSLWHLIIPHSSTSQVGSSHYITHTYTHVQFSNTSDKTLYSLSQ